MKSILYRAICGVVMGVGGVLPGVSGGILAISLGVYEKMVAAIANFFQNIKKNIIYLLPLAIGGGIGILLTSNVLSVLLERFEAQMLSLFAGLVLGSLPELLGEVRVGGQRIKWKHALAVIFGLGFVLLFALGESSAAGSGEAAKLTIPGALISGLVLSVGTVIPGISSSFILVYLGLYSAVIASIAGIFDLTALTTSGFGAMIESFGETLWPFLTMAAAFAVVSILIIRIVNRVLSRHHSTAYAAIIGFVVGSVALVVPQLIGKLTWACPVFFVAGVALSWAEYRWKKRTAKREIAAKEPEKSGEI